MGIARLRVDQMFSFILKNLGAPVTLLGTFGTASKKVAAMAPAFQELNMYPQACANCYVSHDTTRYDWLFCNTCEGAWKSYPYAGPQYPFSWSESPGSANSPTAKKK